VAASCHRADPRRLQARRSQELRGETFSGRTSSASAWAAGDADPHSQPPQLPQEEHGWLQELQEAG